MSEGQPTGVMAGGPLLVYDRVASNRRQSRLLLVALGVLLLPLVVTFGVLLMPIFVEAGSVLMMVVSGLGEEWLRRQTPGRILSKWAVVALTTSVVSTLVVTLLAARQVGGRLLLRFSGAVPLDPGQYPEVARAAAGLSVGAGLPPPSLAFIDNPAPNSFAVGKTRATATIAVTRGLTALLDRRELEAVMAHELAHIGNEDTRLNAVLAVLVATLTWPVTLPLRLIRSNRALVACLGGFMLLIVGMTALGSLAWLANIGSFVSDMRDYVADSDPTVRLMIPIIFGSSAAPLYIVFIGPAVALTLRRALARRRELLADGEAVLLTRDPEGLALALTKIGAATGELRGADIIAHLFIVDPFGNHPRLLGRLFPTHPPVAARIALLSREGPGIDPTNLARAADAGTRFRASIVPRVSPAPSAPRPARQVPALRPQNAEQRTQAGEARRAEGLVPLYEAADGWSRVIASLPADTVLRRVDEANYGNFIKVQTPGGQVGYVSTTALMSVRNVRNAVEPGPPDANPGPGQ